MAKANKAISLGVSAIIAIVIILIVGFGVYLNATFNITSTTSSSFNAIGATNIGSSNSSSVQTLSTATTSTCSSFACTSSTSELTETAQTLLPVICCINLPQSFIVGGYSFQDFQYSPLPPIIANGTTRIVSGGVLLVFEVTSFLTNENISFTWVGTFSETLPSPSTATAFNGLVSFAWLQNISASVPNLSLKITIFAPASTTTQVTGGNATNLVCTETSYVAFADTTSTVTVTTFTSTTNVTEGIGYVTTTTSENPPSAWTVIACTYVK